MVGPPVEVWRCSGERAVNFLTIFLTRPWRVRMSEEWRCVLILILKNKGDEWKGFNYREMMWRKAWRSGGMLQKEEVQKSVEAKHDHETERWKGEVDKGF